VTVFKKNYRRMALYSPNFEGEGSLLVCRSISFSRFGGRGEWWREAIQDGDRRRRYLSLRFDYPKTSFVFPVWDLASGQFAENSASADWDPVQRRCASCLE